MHLSGIFAIEVNVKLNLEVKLHVNSSSADVAKAKQYYKFAICLLIHLRYIILDTIYIHNTVFKLHILSQGEF